MSADSQVANLQAVSDIGNLVHEVFVDKVVPHYAHLSPAAGLFTNAKPGEYTMVGKKLVFSADLLFTGGALATDGYLPDHEYVDPVPMETTPARMYVRRAVDEFVVARGMSPGAFEEFGSRVERQGLEAFHRMTTRHVHGASTASVCVVASRTSSTVFVVKDGYGHAGTNPLMHVRPGMALALLDSSNAFATLGAARIESINYSTKTITFASPIDASPIGAAGDVFVFPTTTDTSATRFKVERGFAPLGLRDLLDPDGNNSAYLTISEATHPEIKPVRKASSDFTEVEVMEFIGEVEAQGQTTVSPETHTFTTQKAVEHELAKTLIGYTQMQQKGAKLQGGWDTVMIGPYRFLIDAYHTHDELMLHCLDDYRVVPLGSSSTQGAVATPDGNKYARLADFDGKEWYMRAWLQRFMVRRNRSGVLTGISVSSADRFAAVPR
ncbi:MAG TPA: hypothetical protein VFI96_06690 [Longimicrobiaceae bacterium]|nr:hypothetical protein [Longimicrobiaceae bacterium]